MVKPLQSSRDVIVPTAARDEATRLHEVAPGVPGAHRSLVGVDAGGMCRHVARGSRQGEAFEFLAPAVAAAKERRIAAGCCVEEEDPRFSAAASAIRSARSSISAARGA